MAGYETLFHHVLAGCGHFISPALAGEGMPNALLEAMALGLPCIATDCPCGGPASVIRSGENGLLVPVGDEDALSRAMAALLSDGELRQTLAENAKQTAEGFRPEAVFRQWEAYVRSVIDGKENEA